MTKQKTESLLGRAMRGDTGAFGEVIKRYQHLVYALALQIARDPVAAQDIAQDTFISAFQSLKDLRSEESFPSWLRTITRNKAFSWRKGQDRIAPLEEAGEIDSSVDPPRVEIEAEHREVQAFRAEVWRIVSALSDTLRFPILLCYVNDIPTAEAASFLGIKEGTLRKRLHDGKKKLQGSIVQMAENTLQECRLPPGFTRRCICGCQRGVSEGTQILSRKGGDTDGKERKLRVRVPGRSDTQEAEAAEGENEVGSAQQEQGEEVSSLRLPLENP